MRWGRDSHEVVFLVRHAEAGSRTDRPDDHLRPLSIAGRGQSLSIARLFDSVAVGDVLSSPFVRCVETLEPLARRRGRNLVETSVLAEGAPIDQILSLLAVAPAHSVLCTHGDVLDAVADHVAFTERTCGDADRLVKGVVWVLNRDGDRWSVVELISPPVCGSIGQKHRWSSTATTAASSDIDGGAVVDAAG